MFEHQSHPLLSQREFFWRILRYTLLSFGIIFVSLAIGILGYHYLEGLPWIDALYALFSGMILLVAVSVLIAPVFHRFHLDLDDETSS